MTRCNSQHNCVPTALGFQGVFMSAELGGESKLVKFCDWYLKTLQKFEGQMPVGSNAQKMFLCVYAVALAMSSGSYQQNKLRFQGSVESWNCPFLMALPLFFICKSNSLL